MILTKSTIPLLRFRRTKALVGSGAAASAPFPPPPFFSPPSGPATDCVNLKTAVEMAIRRYHHHGL